MNTIDKIKNGVGINVLSLCDGMSGGQIALKELDIKVNHYYASEIKEIAIKATQSNFPNTIHIGDVNNINYKDGVLYTEKGNYVDKIDMVMFGSPCFEEGAKVLTKNGYKNIENVNVGDYVLTHNNRYRKVLRTGYKFSDTVKLNCQGMLSPRVTLNHPYYVSHMHRKGHNSVRTLTEPEWVKVQDMKVDDFVSLPINKENNNPYNLDKETCYLLGRYVADGYVQDGLRSGRKNSYYHQVVFCIGKAKLNDFINNFDYYKYGINEERTVYKVRVINERFMELCKKCGKGAKNKKVPDFILNLPVELSKEFLRGYISGDGNIVKDTDDRYSIVTVSKDLILGLQMLIAKVYQVNCIISTHIPEKTKIIENRVVNQSQTYSLTFTIMLHKQSTAIVDDNFVWTRYRGISDRKENQKVYNLEVEDDNSYTVNNIVVHNCQSFSRAMRSERRIGLEDEKKSGLFLTCNRIYKEVNPEYFLVENVVMKKEDEDVISDLMGVKPIRINASLVTAQLRDRLYWTNIPNVTIPENRNIELQSILTDGYTPHKKAKCLMCNDSHGYYNGCNWTPIKRFYRWYYKCFTNMVFPDKESFEKCLEISKRILNGEKPSAKSFNDYKGNEFDCARYLWKEERARLQGVPEKYVECMTEKEASDLLGDGWCIEVIKHIFNNLKM